MGRKEKRKILKTPLSICQKLLFIYNELLSIYNNKNYSNNKISSKNYILLYN